MSVTLSQIQEDLQARLEAHAYFADITVIVESQKDFLVELEKGLADMLAKNGKMGAFAVIGIASADVSNPEVPGPDWDPLALTVIAYETPLYNKDATTGTGKTAFEIVKQAAYILHDYRPDGLADTIYCDRNAIRPAEPLNAAQLAYGLAIRIPDKDSAPAKVFLPVISASPTSVAPCAVSLSCGTSGAAIRYTLDGSYPSALNPAALLYTTPFVVSAAATVRAVAAKTNMIDSDSARIVITGA